MFTQLLYCRNSFGNKFIFVDYWAFLIINFSQKWYAIKKKGLEKWVFYNETMIYFLLLLQLSEKAVGQYWLAVPLEKVYKDLRKLSEQMEQADEFTPQDISDKFSGFQQQVTVILCWITWQLPLLSKWLGKDTEDCVRRNKFTLWVFKNILFFLCRYGPGDGLPGVQFIYKIPVSLSE